MENMFLLGFAGEIVCPLLEYGNSQLIHVALSSYL
jgi:hypothetical protein